MVKSTKNSVRCARYKFLVVTEKINPNSSNETITLFTEKHGEKRLALNFHFECATGKNPGSRVDTILWADRQTFINRNNIRTVKLHSCGVAIEKQGSGP